jgi:hypothetical protein
MSLRRSHTPLQIPVTKAASFSGSPIAVPGNARSVNITLNITAAERDSANETYDFYITTSDGVSAWDVAHFTQIATTGPKTFTATILCDLLPQTVTTAAPGVAVVRSGTLATVSGGTNAIKSLGAGLVLHGPLGLTLNHELVIAGTIATGIAYSITATFNT